MKAILRYKDKVASLGLLPTIITLCGLYFFPTTLMLGFGLAISIVALWYNIVKLKTLNFLFAARHHRNRTLLHPPPAYGI